MRSSFNINRPGYFETIFVPGLIILFFLVNLVTITWHPSVWIDEVSYTDPAMNFVLGKGFTSTAWAGQGSTEFWASNAPLHQYLLIPWLKIFGTSQTAARSVNLFYFSISSILLWKWSRNFNIVSTSFGRILLIILFWSGYMISYIYRDGRPDCITLLLAVCILYSVFIPDNKRRKLYICLTGILSPVAGVQLPPYIVIVMAIGFFFVKDRLALFRIGFLYIASVLAGLVLLMFFLYLNGSLYTFLTQTFASGFTITGDMAQMAVYKDSRTTGRISARMSDLLHFYKLYREDISAFILLVFNTIAVLFTNKNMRSGKYLRYTLLISFIIPPAMLVLGRYPFYYSWMGYLIIIITSVLIIENAGNKLISSTGVLACVISILIGFPLRLFDAAQKKDTEQKNIYAFIAQKISLSDTLLGENMVYYAAKRYAGKYYSPAYSGGRGLPLFPAEEKKSVNTLIVSPDNYKKIIAKVGGEWRVTDSLTFPELYLYRKIR